MMKKFTYSLLLAFLMFTSPLHAQTYEAPGVVKQAPSSTPPAQSQPSVPSQPAPASATNIPPEKAKLINQLLQVTEAAKLASDMPDKLLKQIELDYPRLMKEQLDRDGVKSKPDNEEKFQQQILESFKSFSKKFKDRMPQAVNITQVMTQISMELYARYFSEPELHDLINFYNTPTGKKSFQLMPQAMAESMQRSGEMLNPKINELIAQIFQEEETKLKGGAPAKK